MIDVSDKEEESLVPQRAATLSSVPDLTPLSRGDPMKRSQSASGLIPDDGLRSGSTPLSPNDLFLRRVAKHRLFGTDPKNLNMRALNVLILAVLEEQHPGMFSVKSFRNRKESANSQGVLCVVAAAKSGECSSCNKQITHYVCRVDGACQCAFDRWIESECESTRKQLAGALWVKIGTAHALIIHILRKHQPIWLQATDRCVALMKWDIKRVQTICAGVHRNLGGRFEKRHFRTRKHELESNQSSQKTSHRKPKVSADPELVALIRKTWCMNEPLGMEPIPQSGVGHLQSQCPKHCHDASKRCNLKKDGTKPNEVTILDLQQLHFARLQKYKCSLHGGTTRFDIRHPKFELHDNDWICPFGIVLSKMLIVTPAWMLWALKTFRRLRNNESQFYEAVIDLYAGIWTARSVADEKQYPASVVRKSIESVMCSIDSIKQLLRSWRVYFYPAMYQLFNTTLLFRRTPLIMGGDQTWAIRANVVYRRIYKVACGQHDIFDDMENVLTVNLCNEMSEGHYNVRPFYVEAKVLQLLYGKPETLLSNPTKWITDTTRDRNLPKQIQGGAVEWLQEPENGMFREQLKTNGFDIDEQSGITYCKVDGQITNIPKDVHAECNLHGILRLQRALKADKLRPTTHRDYTIFNDVICVAYRTINQAKEYVVDSVGKSLIDWFPSHSVYIRRNHVEITWLLYRILQFHNQSDNGIRHQQQEEFYGDARFKRHANWLHSSVFAQLHDVGKCHFVGLFVNDQGRYDFLWERKMFTFFDSEGAEIKWPPIFAPPRVTRAISIFFRIAMEDDRHPPLLSDHVECMLYYMRSIKFIFSHRLLESDEEKLPIMSYKGIRGAMNRAMLRANVEAQVTSRHPHVTGANGNQGAERFHQQIKQRHGGNKRPIEVAMSEVNCMEDKVHQNLTNIKNQRDSSCCPYDEAFLKRFSELEAEVDEPTVLRKCRLQRGLLSIGHYWNTWELQVDNKLKKEDIKLTARSVLRREHRQVIDGELSSLRPTDITPGLLIYLRCKYRFAFTPLLRFCFDWGLRIRPGTIESLSVDPNELSRLYNVMDSGKFTPPRRNAPSLVPNPNRLIASSNTRKVELPSLNETTNSSPSLQVQSIQPQITRAFHFLAEQLRSTVRFDHSSITPLLPDASLNVLVASLQQATSSTMSFANLSSDAAIAIQTHLALPENKTNFEIYMGLKQRRLNRAHESTEETFHRFHSGQMVAAADSAHFTIRNTMRPSRGDPKKLKRREAASRKMDDGTTKRTWTRSMPFNPEKPNYKHILPCLCVLTVQKVKKIQSDLKTTWNNHEEMRAEATAITRAKIDGMAYHRLLTMAKIHGATKHVCRQGDYVRDWLAIHFLKKQDLNDDSWADYRERFFVVKEVAIKGKKKRRKVDEDVH